MAQFKERRFLLYFVHLEETNHLVFNFLFVLDQIVKLLLSFRVRKLLLVVVSFNELQHLFSLDLFLFNVQ